MFNNSIPTKEIFILLLIYKIEEGLKLDLKKKMIYL